MHYNKVHFSQIVIADITHLKIVFRTKIERQIDKYDEILMGKKQKKHIHHYFHLLLQLF